MSDGKTIRPRRDDDLPACVRLLTDVHAADGYPVAWPADPAGWLTPASMTAAWGAVDAADAPVAHVAAVTPQARDDVTLEVVDGTAAVGAYERLGWQLLSTGLAAWTTNDGRHPVVRHYVAPPRR